MKRATLPMYKCTNASTTTKTTAMVIRAANCAGGTGMCGIPEPDVPGLPMFPNPRKLHPPWVANSPVANPRSANLHHRAQRNGSNKNFSVLSTAGRMDSTADNGFRGGFMGCALLQCFRETNELEPKFHAFTCARDCSVDSAAFHQFSNA